MVWAGWWLVVAGGVAATTGGPLPLPLARDAFDRVTVEVRLGDAGPFRFLLDTGASLSSVSPGVARQLDLPAAGHVRATSAGGDGTLALVRPPAIELGHRRLRVPWLVVLPGGRDHPLARFDGILGQDVLRQIDYLIDVRQGELWIAPPPRLLATYPLARLDGVSRLGPLTVAASDGGRWSIDSGASHVVWFARVSSADARAVLVTTVGARPVRWAGGGTLDLGGVVVRWASAVVADAGSREERGLLPLWLFEAIYVDRTGTASVVATATHGRDPDVSPRFSALEGN